MRVNGIASPLPEHPRTLLSDHLRHQLRLTGTHVGCEHGVCGCCTVLLDGKPVRSCLLLAVKGLLDEHPDPTDEQIQEGISGNLCRCTGYANIRKAVRLAAAAR